jgi:hypothetical protein
MSALQANSGGLAATASRLNLSYSEQATRQMIDVSQAQTLQNTTMMAQQQFNVSKYLVGYRVMEDIEENYEFEEHDYNESSSLAAVDELDKSCGSENNPHSKEPFHNDQDKFLDDSFGIKLEFSRFLQNQ